MRLNFFVVYDNGTIFEPTILDIKDEDLRERFMLVCVIIYCWKLIGGSTRYNTTFKINGTSDQYS